MFVFLCRGRTRSDREHFQFSDSPGEVKTPGSVEGWMDGYLLMAFLRSCRLASSFCFLSSVKSSPEKDFGLEAVHLSMLPILDSFSSGQGYILFLFVSVGGGEKGGTEERLTASPCLDSSVAGSFLCFVLRDDLAPPAFKLFGKVVLTPLSYLIWDDNKNFILIQNCQPLLHPVLDTSCVYCMKY